MSERITALRRLQSIDTKLRRLEGDKLYRSYDIQKKQNQIQKKKEKLLKLAEEMKNFQKTIHMKELDLKSKEAEINKLRTQLNQVKTNKEYSALRSEIAGKEADKAVIEEDILRMMDTFDEQQRDYKSFQKEIESEESLLKELQKQVEIDLKTIEDEMNNLRKKRDEYTSLVDQEALLHYNRLVSHKDALAVVNVVNRVCQGCFMSITAQTLNQLLSNKEITFCHSCGRILYLENHDEE
ncbi:MAG: zinc ribbon domain-containing protein [Candidatus Loosdrechtia sp.]|uniref:zinc ribbon domain-containing protein n=1 Tax=Candidatus Loosdrechtia sp. TaxID=3101272 RepID=UPI003A681768|nr:MAG: C4-type zinc ribbon domain-containing protein [Candidatus Jettenia sp. AMX2]